MTTMLFQIVLVAFLGHALAQTTCYFPNSQVATGNYPCDPAAAVSVCCGAGSVCLDNKVCLAKNQEAIRGACTDSKWNSPSCPQWCTDASTGGTDLISCSNSTGSPADYCCDHTDKCCDSGVGRFRILPSDPATSAIWISSATAFSLVSQSTIPTSSTPGASANSTSTSDRPKETAGSPSSHLSTAAEAGIGVGAGLAVLLLMGFAGLVFWRRRGTRKRANAVDASNGAYNSQTHQHMDAKYAQQGPVELSGEHTAELGGQSRYELPGEGVRR